MASPDKDQSFFDKLGNWLSHSITLRLLIIGFLILIMMIPISTIESLIREREYRQDEAQSEISEKWGHPQTISGVVLSVPYISKYSTTDEDGHEHIELRTSLAHFLPSSLDISGSLTPETRYRGIYETVVYATNLSLVGSFSLYEHELASESRLRWDEAVASIGISDLRSIQEAVSLEWNGEPHSFNPGLPNADISRNGISVPVTVDSVSRESGDLSFRVDLQLKGSKELFFTPLGKETTVHISSPWASPSFDGSFLPTHREVTKEGFEANWKVLNLNRGYPQAFTGSQPGITSSAFGVSLFLPVDHYQKSMRAAKYAVLFITLTFAVFFFIQILAKVRIHPIQYIMVGLALSMFYTLLISLSEHILFGWAYLIAASSIIVLVGFYAQGTFKSLKLTGILAFIMGALYVFIFSIIQLQDLALLVGSLGLFFSLAVVMYITRNINWYDTAQFTQKKQD